MLSLEMERRDWERLGEFVGAANRIREAAQEAKDTGKQQLSLNGSDVDLFLGLETPPDFWLRLGSLLGQVQRGDGT